MNEIAVKEVGDCEIRKGYSIDFKHYECECDYRKAKEAWKKKVEEAIDALDETVHCDEWIEKFLFSHVVIVVSFDKVESIVKYNDKIIEIFNTTKEDVVKWCDFCESNCPELEESEWCEGYKEDFNIPDFTPLFESQAQKT